MDASDPMVDELIGVEYQIIILKVYQYYMLAILVKRNVLVIWCSLDYIVVLNTGLLFEIY